MVTYALPNISSKIYQNNKINIKKVMNTFATLLRKWDSLL